MHEQANLIVNCHHCNFANHRCVSNANARVVAATATVFVVVVVLTLALSPVYFAGELPIRLAAIGVS